MTILFFVYFGTHNNKIHTIYKQTTVVVLVLLATQQQQKIVSQYSMPMGLGSNQWISIYEILNGTTFNINVFNGYLIPNSKE
jgi:hypothetical protein